MISRGQLASQQGMPFHSHMHVDSTTYMSLTTNALEALDGDVPLLTLILVL